MTTKRMILSATLSAALITFAGTAYANDRDGELLLPLVIAQSADGDTGSTLNAKPETPPDSIIGMDVVNADGETIGKVSKIADDQVIVSVGGFLGIGEHEVALPWSKFTTNGSGDNAKLEVALTKDELKEMPQYKNPE